MEQMTDADIVAGLRSEKPEDRRKALEALYPDQDSVIMAMTAYQLAHTIAAKDALRVFSALVLVAEKVGQGLGMKLQWFQGPQEKSGLVIAGPDQLMK